MKNQAYLSLICDGVDIEIKIDIDNDFGLPHIFEEIKKESSKLIKAYSEIKIKSIYFSRVHSI